MTYQTVILSSFDEYLGIEIEDDESRREEIATRNRTIQLFPYCLMRQVAFPEMDYANRWAWQQFGPRHGECFDVPRGSKPVEYPMCNDAEPHSHHGSWCCHWFDKTEFDFGFCEWYFLESADRDRFREFAPSINWGENFPNDSESKG